MAKTLERESQTVEVMSHNPFKVIFLCGPPRCGKDTLAKLIFNALGRCSIYKMTSPMDDMLQSVFQLQTETFRRLREQEKDVPQKLFNGLTPRQVLIKFSEDFMKPNFGADIFGKLAVRRLSDSVGNLQCTVISDSGFHEEAVPLLNEFGAKNCIQIVLHRDGCTFEGDSRSVWSDMRIHRLDIYNNHSLNRLQSLALFELVDRMKLGLKPGFQYRLD